MKNFQKTLFLTAVCLIVCLHTYAQYISTVAGTGTAGYSGDGGPATAAKTTQLSYIAIDKHGNFYISDWYNNCVRRVDTMGIITTVAGTGVAGYNGDGAQATASKLNYPMGLAIDTNNNLYIVDQNNYRVRMVNSSGLISTVVGTGVAGFSGDGGPATAAKLVAPIGLACHPMGGLIMGDAERIRTISASGIINTIAGTGISGFSGDGGMAAAAKIFGPSDFAYDAAGNLYFSDENNHRIRKITPTGIISTVAGTGTAGFSGDGGPASSAKIFAPVGLVLDTNGVLYFADNHNNRIRRIDASGNISTIAGTGGMGFSGDGGLAIAATLFYPIGMRMNTSGQLFFAENGNRRVRKLGSMPTMAQNNIAIPATTMKVYPNPNNGTFDIKNTSTYNGPIQINVTNIIGQTVANFPLESNTDKQISLPLQPGLYIIQTNSGNNTSAIQMMVK